MARLHGFGRLKATESNLLSPSSPTQLSKLLHDFNSDSHPPLTPLPPKRTYISRGSGRAYGDLCLNDQGYVLSSLRLDRLISFDPDNLTITCESGVLLRDLQRFLVPRGFMLPVTPGTQLVTVGGAIASDVHCKNHHTMGTFGCHVMSLTLHRSDGSVLVCSADQNQGYFRATIAGCGLTGFISQATLSLRRVPGPFLSAQEIPYSSLDEFRALNDESCAEFEHTVCWTDCMTHQGQRGIYMRANHVEAPYSLRPPRKTELAMPVDAPFSLVTPLTTTAFDHLYYSLHARRSAQHLVHYEPFFYPLDFISGWEGVYGPKGFYEFQCVLPWQDAYDAVREIQHEINNSGQGSFLSVLKSFGPRRSPGILSFPRPGLTYAMDFPNRSDETAQLLSRLHAVVANVHGRIYLAKDSCQPRTLFEQGYGEALKEFSSYVDPACSSDLSRRLMNL